MRVRRVGCACALVLIGGVWLGTGRLSAQEVPADTAASLPELLAAARVQFDELRYEQAVPLLDRAIGVLITLPAGSPNARASLIQAYEMRGRSRFGIGNRDGARDDFAALLALSPAYALPEGISPAIASMFDETRAATIGELTITLTEPADGQVTLDGDPVAAGVPVALVAGVHRVRATRPGYAPKEQDVDVAGGGRHEAILSLDRVSATLLVMTSPADVEVYIDGILRGKTRTGPPPEAYAGSAQRMGVPIEQVSQPMLIDEITTGLRVIELKRPCFVTTEERLSIREPADYELPRKLEKAVASVVVETPSRGAIVLLDGESKGTAPLTLPEVCEGHHTLELVSPHGRAVKRFEASPREQLLVRLEIKPSFALLSSAGQSRELRGAEDLRLRTERLLERSTMVTVFAPPDDRMHDALRRHDLVESWLSLGPGGEPLDPAAAAMTSTARAQLSAALAKTFDVQGIAAVTLTPPPDPGLVVALLAPGSGDPDVLTLPLNDADGLLAAIAALDARPTPFARSIGLVAVDVVDREGAVVVRVPSGGPAGAAGITPGEVVDAIDGRPVKSAGELAASLDGVALNSRVTLDVRTRAGTVRQVQVAVGLTPRLVSLTDQTTLFNKLAADLRFRLATATDPAEDSALRINHAVALMRLGSWAEARRELQRVRLADGPGIANGTVRYLLGLCHEAMGETLDAREAFEAAAKAEGALLTEDGPLVSELAARKLGAR